MAFVIPAGNTENPFVWSQIMARQQDQQASEARARADQAQFGMIETELGRQNMQLDEASRMRLMDREYDLRQRNDAASAAATARSTGSSGTVPEGNTFYMSMDVFNTLPPSERANIRPVPGMLNNRGMQLWERVTPDPNAPPEPGAENAAAQIRANENTPAPRATAPLTGTPQGEETEVGEDGTLTMRTADGAYTARPNADGTFTVYDPQGRPIGNSGGNR